jgi:hypothetical protein
VRGKAGIDEQNLATSFGMGAHDRVFDGGQSSELVRRDVLG